MLAAVSSREKLGTAARHGAAEVIDDTREKIEHAVRRFTSGGGANVVHPVGLAAEAVHEMPRLER
ncbi:MAG: hypothetical protein K2X43_07130 [Hyphomonadaceae bacterium]|nr:hypothetical protein [Hyphomonadaceae bacterium]